MKIIDTIGDVNPIEHGGGVVVEEEDGGYTIEYTHGTEATSGDILDVFQVRVEDHVFNYHDWVDVTSIADSEGMSKDELLELGVSPHVMGRVAATQAIAGYCGWYELDQYPFQLTEKELEERWETEED